jgi:DNA-binding MarR family transcriptional regulator
MEKEKIKKMVDTFSGVMRSVHMHSYHNMDTMKLYPGQPKFLALIKQYEGVTQKELAELHGVKPATITGLLVKLEANQFVKRVPDEADKRILRVYLTPKGRKLAEHSEKFVIDLTEKMFQGFTEEELQMFLSLSQKIIQNLQSDFPRHNCGSLGNKHKSEDLH